MLQLRVNRGRGSKAKSSLVVTLLLCVVLILAVKQRYIRFEVTGDSMYPTLTPGDKVIVGKNRRCRVGDVVVLSDPRDRRSLIVKRVQDICETEVYVVGDNPDSSTDSRHFGPVPLDLIVGSVKMRYYPLGVSGSL